MADTKYGYMHNQMGQDMDGTQRSFVWIEDHPDPESGVTEPAWFAKCEIEPEAEWIGGFETEAEAIRAATTKDGFIDYLYSGHDEEPNSTL